MCFDLKAHQCDYPHCANTHTSSHPYPPSACTHTQPNKYCLPILCHSTPWREAHIDRQHSFAWSIVSFFTSLSVSRTPHILHISQLSILPLIFYLNYFSSWAHSQKPLKLWSVSFGFIFDQLPSIPHVGGCWEGRRSGSSAFDCISQKFSMARCALPHPWFAQPATVSRSIMCCWEGQRVTWNHLSPARLNTAPASYRLHSYE